MKAINLVLFGDQAVEKLTSIQALVHHAKQSPAARRLLQDATDVVQVLANQLSKEDLCWDHEVHTLLQLAEDNVTLKSPNAVIATVLMCIGRLGELIRFIEEDPSILGSENDRVQVLAFCTGLLPAAALVAAKDSSELLDLATEIVAITFRMSIAIQRRLTMIEDSNMSWAITLVGRSSEQVQQILDEYHRKKQIPYTKRVAVSVISGAWMTLTGAPSSLRGLMKFSKDLDECPKIDTDTKAAHTPYLPPIDMDVVLGTSPLLNRKLPSKARILSPSSCKPYVHSSLRSLLREMIEDIVSNVLLIDRTTETCASLFKDRPVSLIVAGPTGHQAAVERVLKLRDVRYQIREHEASSQANTKRGGSDLIAVVGMAARLPGSDTVDAFFENLMDGKVQLKKIPDSRFDLTTYHDRTGERRNTTSADEGAFLENPGLFDNRLFSISPREALQMDPLQRLLLMTSWEALEMAGYSKDATPATQSNRIATYFGQAANDWNDVLNNDDIDIYYVPALSRPFGPGRLAYHHKWGGGTYSLDTACATSTTAIHLACQALASRACDTALAGGGSLCISPMTFAGLSKSGMISDHGGCRTYHDDADGYARGEGIGIVVLKRLEDARADNDNILGIINGHARMYSNTSTSITHPSAESQARLYREVLGQTATAPNEIAYVEMHGTGTQAGDLEEMRSVIHVLGSNRSKTNMLTVGAVKANVGHGEGAAGVSSLIKVLMMMRERRIPPQPGLPFKLNQNFPDLDALNVRIAGMGGKDLALRASPASRDGKIKCLVSTFDASGGNTSLVVEEAPERPEKHVHPLEHHVVSLSAKTPASLRRNKERLLEYLSRNPQTKLADLAYTTTARRMHEVLPAAYTGSSIKEIVTKLRDDLADNASVTPKKPKRPTIIFAFTGQGSHYAFMGRDLYKHNPAFREMLRDYQQMSEHQGLPRFLHCISDDMTDDGTPATVSVQLAIVALEIATAKMLKSWGIEPDLLIGHSLGEYTALCISGVLSVSDTLYLAGRRAQLMKQKLVSGQYSMLAISKTREAIESLLAAESHKLSKTTVACLNAPQITVVSGPLGEIKQLQTILEAQGSKATTLRTPYGFHSHHVQDVIDDYKEIARAIHFAAPQIPISSSLHGKIVEAGESRVFDANYLGRQARDKVDFIGAVRAYQDHKLSKAPAIWIEVGPEPVCTGLARRILGASSDQFVATMRSSEDNWKSISKVLASLYQSGVAIKWSHFHRHFSSSLTLLSLPTYAFDEKDYWKPYVAYVDPAAPRTEITNETRAEQASRSRFSTTSLQWIDDESLEGKSFSATFASRTSDPYFFEAIQGHSVNGVAIASMSVFCDMAKSAAQYAHQRLHPDQKLPTMSVYDVNMTQALVVPTADSDQIVRTTITLCDGQACVTFASTQGSDASINHGSLRIVFEDCKEWFSQQHQVSFLVNARIESLKDACAKGLGHRLMKPVAYRLFSNLVDYSSEYKAMEEVWIDDACHDAAAKIIFAEHSTNGRFLYNPFWTDGAIHVTGLLLNAGLKYPEDTVCLCDGLGSWRITEELRAGETYTTYTAMQDSERGNVVTGSAYIYDSSKKLVQVVDGIRFHKMKRAALSTALSLSAINASNLQPALQAPKIIMEKAVNETDLPANLVSAKAFESDRLKVKVTAPLARSPDIMQTFLSIVASECGCTENELDTGTLFADVGVDSLMAITIIATFRKQTSIDLPVTFFLEHQTVAEATEILLGPSPAYMSSNVSDIGQIEDMIDDDRSSIASIDSGIATPMDVQLLPDEKGACLKVPEVVITELLRPSKAVLLHGQPASKGRKLFLLPDGIGSPSSYIQLAPLDQNLNIYAIQSPFMRKPAEFTCSVEEICDSFIEAIRETQASGPYLLGGYSYGALYAYEVSRMLGIIGEVVDGLFIVDMAVPRDIKLPLEITQEQITKAGLFPTAGVLSPTQREHITRTINSMAHYHPKACAPYQRPKRTVLILSNDGLGSGLHSDLSRWAYGSTSTLRGWDKVIPGAIERRQVGGTHFALFRYPLVNRLGDVWADALQGV